ncbi:MULTISPECIES: peptide chain release factor 3 [Acidithrix]|uniref:Peptide chain release factor 3 n=1 Tax=Acidithrix ferrooxidans TaxID=1280514 RepID=A0A0D8HHE4_9ACTN|nr:MULTISPECIES: peptide chain release factor 3 [Acidithrix]KJF17207.1 peptide chain release factor 3 [Acidithrix ferrooxidans]CAG4913929.1 unnamed protein product [Acidithrix sp. C25]
MGTPEDLIVQASQRRRTFAIISHPDAGKTTLTEKFLLYSGQISQAGAVKARSGGRAAVSDWMAMEQQRGISITSTVLQFSYRDHVINLLDTPGHRDFSEDTYRVLSAVDAAVMVLDVAKGIEPQTLKLFEVCRTREVPIITFLNKLDRPGLDPLEVLDQIESKIGVRPTPITWPVGIPGDFRGVIDRRSGNFIRFSRTAHGAQEALEEEIDPTAASHQEGENWKQAVDGVSLLDEVGATYDKKSFLAGQSSPVFVGSALTNFGVRHLLDAIVDLAPAPSDRHDLDGNLRPIESEFSGFVFKIQANMDPSHRDHLAFVRVCSGKFQRGMGVTHAESGRILSTKYATSVFGSDRDTVEEAFPGDVVGLVNSNELRIGDTLYVGDRVEFPPIPTFVPELFALARARDTGRFKQFRKGIEQLEKEGVVQVLFDPSGDPTPMVAAIGEMQFDVFSHRMHFEFGAEVELTRTSHKVARRTDQATASELGGLGGVRVRVRRDGTLLALFESPYWLARLQNDHPTWKLDDLIA